ncbi:MAG: hypothetical protein RL307_1567 [Pseudomonadota bacterium]|jgi:3-oxoadipate enol-lactonase
MSKDHGLLTRPQGAQIAWRIQGASHGPVVLLSNSLAADQTMWSEVVQSLAATHRLITYDNRGHGLSTCPDAPSSLSDLALDAMAVLDAAGVEKVWWLGVSLGGMTGMQAALDHPQRLLGLMACHCRARIDQLGIDGWNQREAIAREQGMSALAEPTLSRWFTPEVQARQPQTMAAVKAMIARQTPEGYATCTHAIKTMQLWDRLGEWTLPTCFLSGAQDGAAPPAEMQLMAERVKGARFEVFDPCGHLSCIERPTDLVNLFLNWSGQQAR